MTRSIRRKAAILRQALAVRRNRRSSDVGMVLAICIGIVFIPVIGLCAASISAAAMSEATPVGPRHAAAKATLVADRTP